MAVYTTRAGDMWDLIAYEQLGSVNETDRLMNMNPQHRNTYIFPSGAALVLPERKTKISRSLPPWKKQGETL